MTELRPFTSIEIVVFNSFTNTISSVEIDRKTYFLMVSIKHFGFLLITNKIVFVKMCITPDFRFIICTNIGFQKESSDREKYAMFYI